MFLYRPNRLKSLAKICPIKSNTYTISNLHSEDVETKLTAALLSDLTTLAQDLLHQDVTKVLIMEEKVK